jgi:hypothetical protein
MSAKPELKLVVNAPAAVAAPEVVIRGITSTGEKFRPSDWAERLYYAVASYGPYRRITFNPMVTLRIDGSTKCIAINPALRDIDSMTFDFLIGFARANDLQLVGLEA